MKAFRYFGPGQVAVEEMPAPAIGPDELLVAITACGICGTDVKTYLRGHPKIPPGAVLGHEMAGVVVASHHARFASGQRVVVAPYAPCLQCDTCRRGHFSLCDNLFAEYPDPGGFAELLRVPRRIVEQGVLALPDLLDDVTATLTEPLACCLHGLEAIDVQAGQSLLIIGDGPMGLLHALLARQLGAAPILLSGMTPQRLAFARQVADHVIEGGSTDLAAAVHAIAPAGVDKVMVAVADENIVAAVLPLVRKGGAINLFAGMAQQSTVTLPARRIHYDEIAIKGTFGFWPRHFQHALELLAAGALALDGFITARVHLDEIEAALIAASHYEGIKAVMTTG
jgi:L-iditol 2-dehydrogenase